MATIRTEEVNSAQKPTEGTNRRRVLLGAGAVGAVAAAGALAACGTGSGNTASGQDGPPASAANLAKSSDIPVGGGKIFANQLLVVTQPTSGTFKAFSAVCTHQGCTVSSISGGLIMCPCHGSEYSIVDGSVKRGPAPTPLPAKTVTVTNGEISIS
jgi:Rieske Fe-S protein